MLNLLGEFSVGDQCSILEYSYSDLLVGMHLCTVNISIRRNLHRSCYESTLLCPEAAVQSRDDLPWRHSAAQ